MCPEVVKTSLDSLDITKPSLLVAEESVDMDWYVLTGVQPGWEDTFIAIIRLVIRVSKSLTLTMKL